MAACRASLPLVTSTPPEPPPGIGRYADYLTVTLRKGDDRLDELPSYEDALYANLSIGGDVNLEELGAALSRWVGERHGLFSLSTARHHYSAGAEAITAELVITVLASGVTQIALEELWLYVRSLLPSSAQTWNPVESLRQLDGDELTDALRRRVALAVDRRRSELSLIQLLRENDDISAVFETSEGTRYVIRATATAYLVRHVSDPA